MTNMENKVPAAVLAKDIKIERIKLLFRNVFSYAIIVKSIGQNVTAPLFAAAFPLKEIANRLISGNKQISATRTKKIVLHITNIFLLNDTRRISDSFPKRFYSLQICKPAYKQLLSTAN